MSNHGYGCKCDYCRGGSRVNGVIGPSTWVKCKTCQKELEVSEFSFRRWEPAEYFCVECISEREEADDWKSDPRTFTLAEYLEMPASEVSEFIRSRFRP